MSTLHFGWANLPCPMEGFEVADGDDGLAYVYGQDAAARTRVSRIVNALQGTSELTTLRQQVADLRAALEDICNEAEGYGWDEHDGKLSHIEYVTFLFTRRVLAATQPQEVQP